MIIVSTGAQLKAPVASSHHRDLLACAKTAGRRLTGKQLPGNYLYNLASDFHHLQYSVHAEKGIVSVADDLPINTIFVLISRRTPSAGGNILQFTDFLHYSLTTELLINKEQHDWEEQPYIWKVDVMRPFRGDNFMHGSNFDSTADPSLWQFYK